MKEKIGALILASGKSKRMGFPKENLPFGNQGTFLKKIISDFHLAGIMEIAVVINKSFKQSFYAQDYGFPSIRWVINQHPEASRTVSIRLGLFTFHQIDYCFLQNIDNPFTSFTLLNKMIENRKPYHCVVPVHNDKSGHPVLLDHSFINKILMENESKVDFREAFKNHKKIIVPFDDDKILANINNREDYMKYFGNFIYTNQYEC